MERKRIEIEAKFPLFNREETIKILKKKGKTIEENNYQKDIYYTPIHKNFLDKRPISEWLRIRDTKDEKTINYKNHYLHVPSASLPLVSFGSNKSLYFNVILVVNAFSKSISTFLRLFLGLLIINENKLSKSCKLSLSNPLCAFKNCRNKSQI